MVSNSSLGGALTDASIVIAAMDAYNRMVSIGRVEGIEFKASQATIQLSSLV